MGAIIGMVIMVAQCPALYPESQTVNNTVSKILLLGKSSSQRQSSSGPGEAAVDARTRCRVGWKREESPLLALQLLPSEPDRYSSPSFLCSHFKVQPSRKQELRLHPLAKS